MQQLIIKIGYEKFDKVLGGGAKSGDLMLFYGEAATGKTAFLLYYTLLCTLLRHRVLFLTTEKPFAIERLVEMSGRRWKEISRRITIIEIKDFKTQLEIIERLEFFINPKIKLITIDTITEKYREFLSEGGNPLKASKCLNRQLAMLYGLAKLKQIIIIISGQVRELIEEGKEEVIASKLLRNWSNKIIKLEKIKEKRIAHIEKTIYPKYVGSRILFKITSRGIEFEY